MNEEEDKLAPMECDGCDKKVEASITDQALSLGQTMARSWEEMVSGNELMVDEYEQQRRFDICQVCEHYIKHSKRCAKCGCFLKMKIKMKVSECPIQKW